MNWQVTQQRDTTKLIGGNLVDGKDVTVMFDGTGDTATLFVPLPAYTPDRVRAIIEDYAATHNEVANLTGSV